MSGKLIVFEGTDGSGKATQAKLLCETLAQRGIAYREIDFPRYGNPFAEPANLYLHGALGNRPGDVNAYAASVLYAVDRFASYKEDWGGFYEEGGIVVANRYTTSNAVHQASTLPEGERQAFLDWLFDLEYGRMGLPAPDLVLYLDLPTEVSEKMLRHREQATATGHSRAGRGLSPPLPGGRPRDCPGSGLVGDRLRRRGRAPDNGGHPPGGALSGGAAAELGAVPDGSKENGTNTPHFLRSRQQQPLLQPSLPHPQPQLLPPRAFPLPQQQQISTTMMMSHRQEQLLFPLLKHMIVTSL